MIVEGTWQYQITRGSFYVNIDRSSMGSFDDCAIHVDDLPKVIEELSRLLESEEEYLTTETDAGGWEIIKYELPRQKAENKAMRVELEQPDPIQCEGERTDVAREMAIIKEHMHQDPDFAWGWHCNIAMASVDEGMDHDAANRAAARFMYAAFDQKLENYDPNFKPKQPEDFEVWEHTNGRRAYWYKKHFIYLDGYTFTPFGEEFKKWKFTGDVVNLDALKG